MRSFGKKAATRFALAAACALVLALGLAACSSGQAGSGGQSGSGASGAATSGSAAGSNATSTGGSGSSGGSSASGGTGKSGASSGSSGSGSASGSSSVSSSTADPKDQISFGNLKIDTVDYGEDRNTYDHPDRYTITLTGTMTYTGTKPLQEVVVTGTCTTIGIDKYNEEVSNEGQTLPIGSSTTYGVYGKSFYNVKAKESRPFTYIIGSDVRIEDPEISVYRASETISRPSAEEGDFTVTATATSTSVYGFVKNNTDKLFDQIEILYYGFDKDGNYRSGNDYIEHIRPGGEYPIEYLYNDDEIRFEGLLAVLERAAAEDEPAVSLEKEFPYTVATGANGSPVVTVTNKSGKYLNSLTVHACWINAYGSLSTWTEYEESWRPDEQREIAFGNVGANDADFTVYDVTYRVDTSKENSRS